MRRTLYLDETCQVAFEKLKELLLNSSLLAHYMYDPNKPVRLAVDASSYGLGAVLSHVFDDVKENQLRMLPAVSQQVSKIIQ